MVLLNIVWPTFALVLLVFVVWFSMVYKRVTHMKRTPPTATTFDSAASAHDYFRSVDLPANNLANLFEMPVLYFALVPLLLVTQQASLAQVALAWLFVLLRVAHSVIHIGPNKVPLRFMTYVAANAVLLAMWIGFFIDLAVAAMHYQQMLGATGVAA